MGQPTEEAFPRVLEKVLVGQSVSYPGTLFYKTKPFSFKPNTVAIEELLQTEAYVAVQGKP